MARLKCYLSVFVKVSKKLLIEGSGMRVFQIEGDWGIQNLKISARPDPKPGPGQVLLRMRVFLH